MRGKFPKRVLHKAVERMLPRGPLGRCQISNRRVMQVPNILTRRSSPRRSISAKLYLKNTNYRKAS